MLRVSYDFLHYVSFPSSIKLFNSEAKRSWSTSTLTSIGIAPKALVVELKAKQQNVNPIFDAVSVFRVIPFDSKGAQISYGDTLILPYLTFDWTTFKGTLSIPSNTTTIQMRVSGGAGTPEAPGITWFDDLKIYQDGVLIYDNYFSAIRPGKVMPVMMPLPEKVIGAWQRRKTGEAAVLEKPMLAALA